MIRTFSRTRRLGAAVLGSIALSLLVPVTASAGSSQHRNDRHNARGDYDRGHDRHARGGHERNHARNHDRNYNRNYNRGDRRHHRRDYRGDRHARYDRHRSHQASRYNRSHHASSRYYCAPCDHGFDSRRGFHSHLAGFHGVSLFFLPFAIVHHALGWIFYG